MNDYPNVAVITSDQSRSKEKCVSVEEGTHDVDAIVVWFDANHWEGLLPKLCGDLVNRECHHFYVKCFGLGTPG